MSRASAPRPLADPGLALKIASPKIRRANVPPAWLARQFGRLRDRAIAVVHAPGGFGKTTLLAEWRRELLARGWLVGWLTVDARDDASRFLSALVASLRLACGNPRFGVGALQPAQIAGAEIGALTELLAAVIEVSRPIVLILDDAHELPEAVASELLPYLLHNLPPELQVIVGSRQPLPGAEAELAGRADFAALGPPDLRLRLEETIEFLRTRFGGALDVDAAARVHELTDGWPMGLQLAAAVLERDKAAGIAALAGEARDIARFFTDSVLSRVGKSEADFIVVCSCLDALHPDLCRAVTGYEKAAALLRRLHAETPIVDEGEDSEWLRMHPLARSVFAGRFAALPEARRSDVHWRAAEWLHEYGDAEAAARHALAAGRAAIACGWVAERLYELVVAGQVGDVVAWGERLPAEIVAMPRVRIALGWARALSYQPAAAMEVLRTIAESADTELRYEAAMIEAGVAVYTDRVAHAEQLMQPWGDESPSPDWLPRQIHANIVSYLAVERGASERGRFLQAAARRAAGENVVALPLCHGTVVVGLSYLHEGRPRQAEDALHPVLERAEVAGGRRSVGACLLAPLVAAACWEQDRRGEAESALAYRIDVIERTGVPEGVVLGFTVLARIASAAGDEARALDLLQRLQSLGEDRGQPRLSLCALAEQLRLQSARRRGATCAALAARLTEGTARAAAGGDERLPWDVDIACRLALAHARIADSDADGARALLLDAIALAQRENRTRAWLEARVLLALASDPDASETRAAWRESLSIAEANGLVRLFADADSAVPKALAAFAQRGDAGASRAFVDRVVGNVGASSPPSAAPPRVPAPALLTAREASILRLLVQGLSNKEIARAADVGQETVKWHLKNLFGKLNAASRRHAVDRARALGLI